VVAYCDPLISQVLGFTYRLPDVHVHAPSSPRNANGMGYPPSLGHTRLEPTSVYPHNDETVNYTSLMYLKLCECHHLHRAGLESQTDGLHQS